MNCPNKMMYRANEYHITMDVNASQLGMFGPTELMLSYDTYQFNDYSRYDTAQIDAEHKAEAPEGYLKGLLMQTSSLLKIGNYIHVYPKRSIIL